jgi:hypothetical protein
MRQTRKNTKTNFRKTRRVKGGGQGQSISTRDRLREKIQKEQADRMNINSILAKQAETDRAKEAVRERDRKRSEKIRIEIAEKKATEEAEKAAIEAAKAAAKAAKAAAKAAVKTKTSSSRKPASTPTPKSPTPKSPTPPKPPTPKSPTPQVSVLKHPSPILLKPPTPPLKLDTKTALKRENKTKKWTSTLNVPTSEFWKEFFKDDELQRLRVELNKPDLCECIKPIFYVPTDATNPVDMALCKLFVIYGIISAKLEFHRYIYNILWKGTRALYLNDANKSLETRDLDIAIVDRHGYVNEDVTNMKHLSIHIGKLSKLLLDDAHIEIQDPSDPRAKNKEIVKLSYKSESGEYIPLSDIGFKQTEYQGQIEYLEKTEPNCVAGNDVLYLYQTIPYMKAEKEYYLDEYQRRLATSSDDSQLKYNIIRMKIGLNKISQIETGADVYDIEKERGKYAEYAKEIYETDKAERLKLQAIVKEGKLTKEELQAIISSRSKRV